jgi:hypothetical protein
MNNNNNNNKPKKIKKPPKLVWIKTEWGWCATKSSVKKALEYYLQHTIEKFNLELEKINELLKNENLSQEERKKLLNRQRILIKLQKQHTGEE